jgi:Leu/Phe-tRNA-protein transferase
MSVDEKWHMLSNDDQLFVEQIINQLLELGGGAISDREYAANLERLEKMKEEPELYAKDAFQVLQILKEKIRDGKS